MTTIQTDSSFERRHRYILRANGVIVARFSNLVSAAKSAIDRAYAEQHGENLGLVGIPRGIRHEWVVTFAPIPEDTVYSLDDCKQLLAKEATQDPPKDPLTLESSQEHHGDWRDGRPADVLKTALL